MTAPRPSKCLTLCLAGFCFSQLVHAQTADLLGPEVRKYVRVGTPTVVLEHVRIIDGTGMPAKPDQDIKIENGKIAAIGHGAHPAPSADVTVLDLRGHSVIPGFVGMHNHLAFIASPNQQPDGSLDRPAPMMKMIF